MNAPRLQGPRKFTPKYQKPVGYHCEGCVLGTAGVGYVPGYATEIDRPILLLAESPAIDEQIHGEPLIGAAGSMLTRILKTMGRSREDYRIDNVARCSPPHQLNLKAYPDALRTCAYWKDATALAPPKVIVTMGTLPTRHVLGLTAKKHAGVEELHGTVHQVAAFPGSYIVPTFHPSHLQRGATNLMGVVAFDLARAETIAKEGWAADPAVWIVDPPPAWAQAWAAQVIAARRQDPHAYPLAVDIETPDKGADEGVLVNAAEDRSYQITRVNFSIHPDEGVTVPYEGAYIPIIHALCQSAGVRYLWFKGFDEPRLLAASAFLNTKEDRRWSWDCMWMAKALQSDLPQGLGFWAPFYSRFGAWKHFADTEPGKYAAIDGFQTRRVGDGLVEDLCTEGMWDIFARHQHHFHQIVLQPATDMGVPIDRERLIAFRMKLDREASRLLDEIQAAVPPELRPLTPPNGLTRPPTEGLVHTKGRETKRDGSAKKEAPDPIKMALYARATVVEKIVLREVNVCRACGKAEVAKSHRCDVSKGTLWCLEDGGTPTEPLLEKKVATVTRWFWHEPFNPDSPDQMMAYVKAKGHRPGRSKTTGEDSVDRETLSRLARESKDPLYFTCLDYRAVGKVRGTYAVGTEKRLDAEDRLHGTFSFKPSTMRLASAAPNLQNVVADKGGKQSLAAGFRECVVAKGRDVEVGSGWEDPLNNEGTSTYQPSASVWSSAKIIEVDFAGIENILLGWCMRDPTYIRAGRFGVHAYLASHLLKRPANLGWPDAQLADYLKAIKKTPDGSVEQVTYQGAKKYTHAKGYGQTPMGTLLNNPKLFKNLKAVEAIDAVFRVIAPGVFQFHEAIWHTAHQQKFLGGADEYFYDAAARKVIGHPYQYKHWFHSVIAYERLTLSQQLWRKKRGMQMTDWNGIVYGITLGEDASRAIAMYPQGTGRAVLTEACFPLFDPDDPLAGECYIGDLYYGATPLRAPIHDSLLLEVPTRMADRVLERCARAMQAPILALPCDPSWGIGAHLTIGVDAKIGNDWGSMEGTSVPSLQDLGVANDLPRTPTEDEDEEAMSELETVMGVGA